MNDDQMDQLLIQGARDYNEPGTVPREEIWGRIAAARRRTASTMMPAPRRVWLWPTVGIAAAALLAVGIGIGRRLEHQSVATPTYAVKPVLVKATGDSTKQAADTLVRALHEETRKTDATVRRLASAEPSRGSAKSPSTEYRVPSPDSRLPTPDSRTLAYRLVVLRHLAGSEALITSFRASAKRGAASAASPREPERARITTGRSDQGG